MRSPWLACVFLVLCTSTAAMAETKPADPAMTWESLADCAAAYQGNWQNRQTGFNRSQDMSNMIQQQAEDYKATAIRILQQATKVSAADAKTRIGSHVTAKVEHYVAMDKAGTLEDFLEKCPQIEPEAPN